MTLEDTPKDSLFKSNAEEKGTRAEEPRKELKL